MQKSPKYLIIDNILINFEFVSEHVIYSINKLFELGYLKSLFELLESIN